MRRRSLVMAFAACTSPTTPAHAPAGPPSAPRPDAAARPIVRAPSEAPSCGKLAAPLDGDVALLAGRLTLRVPGGTGPRAYDLASASASPDQETRIIIDDGVSAPGQPAGEALVILAQETWQLDPDRASADADASVRSGSLDRDAQPYLRAVTRSTTLDVERARVADGALRVYAGRPREVKVADGGDAALVLEVLVSLPDATLQTVGFWVSPSLAGEPGCTGLAERIAATLSPGPRTLERGGARVLSGASPDQALAVTLPEDYVVVPQPGPDAPAYRLFRLRPLGLFPGSISITLPASPNRVVPSGAAEEPGMLLGRPVTWYTRRGPNGGKMIATQPVAPGTSPDARFLQVAIVAMGQAKNLDEFRRVAESIAVVKR